ncbi:hypothetical protein D3C80_1560960 [compost metagenome]
MDGPQALRAVCLTIAEGTAIDQALAPEPAQALGFAAVEGLGELQQLYPLVAAEHNHGITKVAAVQVNPHGQGYIEEMRLELARQALDWPQGTARAVAHASPQGHAGSQG